VGSELFIRDRLYDEAEGCLRPYTEAAAAGRAAGLRGQDLLA
jgi:hypothetical protein